MNHFQYLFHDLFRTYIFQQCFHSLELTPPLHASLLFRLSDAYSVEIDLPHS